VKAPSEALQTLELLSKLLRQGETMSARQVVNGAIAKMHPEPPLKRKCISENVGGNVHDAVRYFNDYVLKHHPEARLVTVGSVSGCSSIVVYEVSGS